MKKLIFLLLLLCLSGLCPSVVWGEAQVDTLRPDGDRYVLTGHWIADSTEYNRYTRIDENVADGGASYIFETNNISHWYGYYISTALVPDSITIVWNGKRGGTPIVAIGMLFWGGDTWFTCGNLDTLALTTSYQNYFITYTTDPCYDEAWDGIGYNHAFVVYLGMASAIQSAYMTQSFVIIYTHTVEAVGQVIIIGRTNEESFHRPCCSRLDAVRE